MHPLMDALKLAEQARSAPMARGAGGAPGPAASGGRRLEPIRATRDDAESGPASPEKRGMDEPSGREAGGRWRLEPIRAMRDGPEPETATVGLDPAASERAPPAHPVLAGESSIPAGGVMVDDADPAGLRIRRPPPERSGAGESRAATRRAFDPRILPRRRGMGRLIGATLPLLAVIGAGTGGGYFIWKTEFVRPALLRRLPPMPVAAMEPAPATNAAMDGPGESAAGVAPGPGVHPAPPAWGSAETPPGPSLAGLPVPQTLEEPRRKVVVEIPAQGYAARPAAASTAGTAASGGRAESRLGPPVGRLAARDGHRPGPVSSASPPASAGRTGSVGRDRPSGIREPVPAVRTAGSIAGAPADASAGMADLPVPAMEHAGMEPPPAPGAGIEIRKRIRADHVTASLGRAYAALLAGDAESAAESYRAVLGYEPANRDAFLGLAAVAARAGRWDEAAGHYTRILASFPADTVARAALIAIAEQDPARGESRLKALLWSEPQAAHLHFSLGNVYAAQSRWAEAQQSYFNAYRFDRRNADYAYNLAVSLEHLSQPGSALGLYREALVLSRSRPASFEADVVLRRIRDLDTSADTGSTSARPATAAASTAPAPRAR